MAGAHPESTPSIPRSPTPEQPVNPVDPTLTADGLHLSYERDHQTTTAIHNLRDRVVGHVQAHQAPDATATPAAPYAPHWHRSAPELPRRSAISPHDNSRYHIGLQPAPPLPEDGPLTEEKLGHFVTNALLRALSNVDPAMHARLIAHIVPLAVQRAQLLYEARDTEIAQNPIVLQRLLDGLHRL